MSSTTPLPPNTCGIHGSYVGSACPTCSTGGGIRHVPVGGGIPASPDKTPLLRVRRFIGYLMERLAEDPRYNPFLQQELSGSMADIDAVEAEMVRLQQALDAQVSPDKKGGRK